MDRTRKQRITDQVLNILLVVMIWCVTTITIVLGSSITWRFIVWPDLEHRLTQLIETTPASEPPIIPLQSQEDDIK